LTLCLENLELDSFPRNLIKCSCYEHGQGLGIRVRGMKLHSDVPRCRGERAENNDNRDQLTVRLPPAQGHGELGMAGLSRDSQRPRSSKSSPLYSGRNSRYDQQRRNILLRNSNRQNDRYEVIHTYIIVTLACMRKPDAKAGCESRMRNLDGVLLYQRRMSSLAHYD
jgi:hypothetical protein